jgi:hypothetical protein
MLLRALLRKLSSDASVAPCRNTSASTRKTRDKVGSEYCAKQGAGDDRAARRAASASELENIFSQYNTCSAIARLLVQNELRENNSL